MVGLVGRFGLYPRLGLVLPFNFWSIGINLGPTVEQTIKTSWNKCREGVKKCILSWSARMLPSLSQRVKIINTFALSKLWYLASVLPIPQVVLHDLERLVRAFLWLGRMEKLPYEELFNPPSAGGLGLIDIASKGDALFVTQLTRMLNSEHHSHLKYWVGMGLRNHMPELRAGPNAQILTQYFQRVETSLKEAFTLGLVLPGRLGEVKAKSLYLEFTSTLPPPKVVYTNPGRRWNIVWKRLEDPVIPPQGRDLLFSILHNIYKNKQRLHRMNQHPTGNCNSCREVETNIHLFTSCPRTQGLWIFIKDIVLRLIPGTLVLDDQRLLGLDFPGGQRTTEVLFLVSHYVVFIHQSRYEGETPTVGKLRGFLRERLFSYIHGKFPRLE